MKSYLLTVLDRAVRTAIQTAAGVLAAERTGVNWRVLCLTVTLAVVVSVLQGMVDVPAIPGGWIGDVTGRALRTFAQVTVAAIGTSLLITDVPWQTVLTAAALAALASVVTSAATTPLGPAATRGTPALTGAAAYLGYGAPARHLVAPRYVTTALTTGTAALLAFAGVTAAGVLASRSPALRPVVATAAPVARPAPVPVDHAPAYLAALKRDGIPTADDQTALLLIAGSVCQQRGATSDDQQAGHIVSAFPGRWSRPQTALIVDAAIDTYCT